MDNVNADFTINTNNQLEAEYSLNSEHFDCSFELYAAGTVWGSISGTLSNQVDLQNALNLKANQSDLNSLSITVGDNYTELNNKIIDNRGEITAHVSNKQNPHEVTKSQVGLGNVDNTSDLNKPISTATQNALNDKQDTISDISTIRENAQNGNSAYETIQTYGDVVNYNASDFATSAQGSLANSALQPGDNVSELVNNAGYITGINSTDVTTALGYTPYDSSNPSGYITNAALTNYVTTNTAQTISNSKAFSQPLIVADNVGLASGTLLSNNKILQRTTDDTLTLNNVNNKLRFVGSETRPQYNSADLALYSDLPTLADLTTEAQLDAINSGATSTNITQITTNKNDISDINDLIPTQATSLNQLADKNFVNSSIATNTANFIGTFNSIADLEAYSGPLTNNDYAFVVGTDSEGNTIYDRYKYTDATTPPSWIFEYELNNSSFTAAQWDAINSGITAGDVTLIGTALQPNDNISVLNNDSGYITGVDWGDIGGTITTQTDLQTALNLKADLSTLATVATSGNYDDLLNKPTIPTVNDATLTIQKNGTDVATFTANSSTNQTANITVPTDNTELTNGAGYITGITSTDVTTALGYTPEDSANKVTTLTNASTYTQYPSAKTVYDELLGKQNTLTAGSNITILGSTISATDTTYTTMIGATTLTDGVSGLVPAPSAGDEAKVLKGDGTWGETPYRNIGEIVTSTIPLTDAGLHLLDGSLILGGGIYNAFVDYIADLYSGTITVYLSNVNIFGNLTDNDGVLSGFNTTSYAQIKQQLPLASANSFDFVFKFTYSPISTYQAIFSENNLDYFSFIGTDANGKLYCQLSNNHTSNNIGYGTGSTTLTSGSTYYVKFSFNGSRYAVYLSNTGAFSGEETTEITINSSLKLINYKWDIGGAAFSGYEFPFQGSIDLADCYIDIDGDRWWSGLTSASLFTTESDWQSAVTQYGACGKFVYDSINNTVRLPKITGIIEGTSDLAALGDLVQAGLPNITGSFYPAILTGTGPTNYYNLPVRATSGAFGAATNTTRPYFTIAGTSTTTYDVGGTFDASRSSSIYGNSLTVQPQTIKVLYYIVIATTTKTDIEVDIDEIATDLNGKADVDGSNMVSSVKNFDGGWVYSNFTVANGAAFSESDVDYDLSSELPNDNYIYEVMFSAYATTGNTSGNRVDIVISGLTGMSAVNMIGINTRTNSSLTIYGNCIIPVGTSRKVRVGGISNPNGTYTIYSRGYRRVGTNS